MGWIGLVCISLGGVRYRAPNVANKTDDTYRFKQQQKKRKIKESMVIHCSSLIMREYACFDGFLVVWQTLQCVSKPPSSISDPLTGLT